MTKSRYYINGVGVISPQKTFDNSEFLNEVSLYKENVLTAVVPDFKQYINPIQMRRMNRTLRMGLSSATICLRDANVQTPDGIITATGYGFLDETYKFFNELLMQDEQQLTPTYFMQSTYNSLTGAAALAAKCMGYSNTFVSRGFAYENAVIDAFMQINKHVEGNYLVGAFDEAAEVQYKLNIRVPHYKQEKIPNLELFDSTTRGSIQGEIAAFYLLSGKPSDTTWCALNDVQLLYKPEDANELKVALDEFLEENNLTKKEIDVLINGVSGDVLHDEITKTIYGLFPSSTVQLRFKHLCGEFCTAGSFATWLGASILKKQVVPEIVKVEPKQTQKRLQYVLIVNQYMNRNFSFQLLEKI